MDLLRFIPLFAVVLINLVVLLYVVRERDRTRSGFFLTINALSLVVWSIGRTAWLIYGQQPVQLALPTFATLLIPANFLYFVATRPFARTPGWSSPAVLVAIFLPTVLISALDNYIIVNDSLRDNPSFGWGGFNTLVGRLSLLYTFTWLAVAVAILVWRYERALPGPDKNLPKHLIVVLISPWLFTLFLFLASGSSPIIAMPSPGILLVLMGQVGLFVVIRQEEIERPLYLSRWIYYTIAVLSGFTVASLVYTIYESVTATVLHLPTIQALSIGGILLALVVAQFPRIHTAFDRLMFRRAFEYRELVREAQAELRETRERLRRAERLSVLGEIAARIAHEIKNPLGPIKGYTQMMREHIEGAEAFPRRDQFLRHLSIVAEEVDAIDRRVHQLLDLARGPAVVRQPADINRLVRRAATLLRMEAAALGPEESSVFRRITVLEGYDESLPPIRVDAHRIEEALANVCRNAAEAVGDEGEISLQTRRSDDPQGSPGICVDITDNGPGLSEEARQKLFTPFFTEKESGTGLGLSIVKSHMDCHGGTVTFHPASPRGTRVTLWLPLTWEPEPEGGADVSDWIDRRAHKS